MSDKQSSVDWLYEKLFHCEINIFEWQHYLEQAKAMHKAEHGKTWDDSMNNLEERGMNQVRAWEDFDEYYEQTYGGKK